MESKKCKKMKMTRESRTKTRREFASKLPALYDEELVEVIPAENPSMKVEPEIEEEFHGVLNPIKSEDTKIVGQFQAVYIEPTVLSNNYEVRGAEKRSRFSKVLRQSTDADSAPLLCRLCATQSTNTIFMLDPNELYKNIIEKIEYCLPITVKETDNLPKQACRMCLEKLELCYQFHKSVAEAEKQLLMSAEQTSGKLDETELFCKTSTLSASTSFLRDVMLPDRVVGNDTVSSNSELQSVELLTTDIHCSDNLDKDDLEEESKSSNVASDSEFILPLITESNQVFSSPKPEPRENDCSDDGSTVKCSVCEKVFKTAEECQTHASLHISRHCYPCCICNEILTTKRDWGRHFLKHTETEKSRNVAVQKSCNESENKFISKLKRKFYELGHKSGIEPRPTPVVQIGNQEEPEANQKKNDRAVECTLCKMKFHPDLLEAHKKGCKVRIPNWRNPLLLLPEDECFSCAHCGKRFEQKKYIIAHLQTHEEQPDSVHGKHFSNAKILRRTVEEPEGSADLSECYDDSKSAVCDKEFRSGNEGDRESCSGSILCKKNHSCPDCEKEFELEVDLAAHILTHLVDRPYSCSMCEKKFRDTTAWDEHKKIHVAPSVFKCSICDKKFVNSTKLKKHIEYHSRKIRRMNRKRKTPRCTFKT